MKTNVAGFKERLYAATVSIIRERGAKGWSMEGLCARSGISKDTLYRVVANKRALIEQAVLYALDAHSRSMEDLLAAEGDFFGTLRRGADLLAKFLEDMPLEALAEVFLEYPDVERTVAEGMSDYYAKLERFLATGKSSGALRKNVDTGLVVDALRVCVLDYLRRPDAHDAPRDVAKLLDYLIEGIAADRGSPRA